MSACCVGQCNFLFSLPPLRLIFDCFPCSLPILPPFPLSSTTCHLAAVPKRSVPHFRAGILCMRKTVGNRRRCATNQLNQHCIRESDNCKCCPINVFTWRPKRGPLKPAKRMVAKILTEPKKECEP